MSADFESWHLDHVYQQFVTTSSKSTEGSSNERKIEKGPNHHRSKLSINAKTTDPKNGDQLLQMHAQVVELKHDQSMLTEAHSELLEKHRLLADKYVKVRRAFDHVMQKYRQEKLQNEELHAKVIAFQEKSQEMERIQQDNESLRKSILEKDATIVSTLTEVGNLKQENQRLERELLNAESKFVLLSKEHDSGKLELQKQVAELKLCKDEKEHQKNVIIMLERRLVDRQDKFDYEKKLTAEQHSQLREALRSKEQNILRIQQQNNNLKEELATLKQLLTTKEAQFTKTMATQQTENESKFQSTQREYLSRIDQYKKELGKLRNYMNGLEQELSHCREQKQELERSIHILKSDAVQWQERTKEAIQRLSISVSANQFCTCKAWSRAIEQHKEENM